MTSKNESNKFFPLLCHHNNRRDRFLWLIYFSVTARNRTFAIMCSGFVRQRSTFLLQQGRFV